MGRGPRSPPGAPAKARLVPETTKLPPLSPGADPWDTLGATEKRVYARYMELYAGLITNLDANIGAFSPRSTRVDGARTRWSSFLRQRRIGRGNADRHAERARFRDRSSRAGRGRGEAHDAMGTDPTFPHYPSAGHAPRTHPFGCTSSTRTSAASPIR
jgi:arylsulfatase